MGVVYEKSLGQEQAPQADEIEVSLLGGGGGTGECTVVHAGNDEWIVVDSFLSRKTRQSASLEYLSKISVPLTAIKLVIASHWHNDHIKGISRLVSEATQAKFAISSALKSGEFATLLEIDHNLHTRQKSIGELRSALQALKDRQGTLLRRVKIKTFGTVVTKPAWFKRCHLLTSPKNWQDKKLLR